MFALGMTVGGILGAVAMGLVVGREQEQRIRKAGSLMRETLRENVFLRSRLMLLGISPEQVTKPADMIQ